jgi:uncharacterized protein YjbJ (UPF0337 family)
LSRFKTIDLDIPELKPQTFIFIDSAADEECWLHAHAEKFQRRRFRGRIATSAINKEDKMGLPNKDEVEGKFDQVKGKTKEAIGRATDDRELEDEGRADHASGKVEEGFGKARRKVGEAIEDVGDAIKR